MHYHSTEKPNHQTGSNSSNCYEDSGKNKVWGADKVVGILSYATLLGWLVAILLQDKQKSAFTTFHLRQSLGLIITGALLVLLPLVGWLINIAVFIGWLYAIYFAIQGRMKKVPVLGNIYQKHLNFIK